MTNTRNILIVEDDMDLSSSYEMMCQIAVSRVKKELKVLLNINVIKAFNYEEAVSILQNKNIDFLSVDLALQEQEKNLKDIDRLKGKTPGGIRILEFLQGKEKMPIILVMSGEAGETAKDYIKDSLQTYGVFAYFKKSQDEDNFNVAIQAILSYLEASTLISKMFVEKKNYTSLNLAEKYWKNAKEKAKQASVASKNFPSNLDSDIANIKTNLVDSATKLPGNLWVEDVLREQVLAKDNWTLIKFQIADYSSFAFSQASQVDPLLTYLGERLIDRCREIDTSIVTFVGIWRHDDPTGPCVLAIFSPKFTMAATFSKTIVADFQEKANLFRDEYSKFPKPEIKYKIWNGEDSRHEFGDWQQIVNILGKPVE